MSFFGFDTALPRDRSGQSTSRGIFETHDPFAGLSRGGQDAGEVLDFEDTYDGLGQHLQETGDDFNDDTFGGDQPVTRDGVGRDFDFAGETAKIRDTLLEEQTLHHARQPVSQARATKPTRTGYEAYKQPEYIPKLEADASIWGKPVARKPAERPQPMLTPSSAPKMMSLEEVEAAMRAQARPPPPPPPPSRQPQDVQAQTLGLKNMLGLSGAPPSASTTPAQAQYQQGPPHILQRPQQPTQGQPAFDQKVGLRPPQQQQRQHSPVQSRPTSHEVNGQPLLQFQQPPQGFHVGESPPTSTDRGHVHQAPHQRGLSYSGPPITQAQQLMQLAPPDREAYLAEEAKRAKRNHKIFLLSKDNGLMTPQDKNFITRIQLQQLLTATGGVDNEPGSDELLAEDFYYQVYASIRGPPRSGPGQPLNQFAQTYLFQTGTRYGYGRSRHHPRGGDNHVQRMEQQVARAVEAAKARPKNKQLVMEGSLGKIAFSNSKTPRPLLNIKRPDSAALMRHPLKSADRKTTLRDIETLYTTLMRLEDHERSLPPPPNEESPPEVIEEHMRWRSEMQELNQQLWEALKVLEPIQPNPTIPHPFIQILSHGKGKKAIPRAFRHLDDQQRLTTLTLVVIHLDILDVIRDAYPSSDNTSLPLRVKEEVELFDKTVMQPLFSYVNEAPINIIIGLLGLVLDRTHLQANIRTKIGVNVLIMLISRAKLLEQQAQGTPEWDQWAELFSRLFDTIEPVLPFLFPTDTPVSASDDVHVWQLLAAMGAAANPDQQQRLVLGVKDRVMETVAISKTLPEDMGKRRLGEVNLFMVAIGLDVELLG